MANINEMVCEALDDLFELNAFEKRAYRGDLSSAASKRGFSSGAGRSPLSLGIGMANNPHITSKDGFQQGKAVAAHLTKSSGADKLSFGQRWLNPVRAYRGNMAGYHGMKSGR